MSLLSYLRKRNSTAAVAKERLQIIISHERSQRNTLDYIPQLQKEILAVIAKYIPINQDQVTVHLERKGKNAILELNVTMPQQNVAEEFQS